MNKKSAIVVVSLILLITIFFGYYASQISVKDDIKSYVPANDPDKIVYDRVAKEFGLNDIVLVGISFDNVYKSFDKIETATKKLNSLDVVDNVISPVNAPRINVTDDGISVGNLESTYNFKSYNPSSLEKDLKNDDMIRGKFVSDNGKSALFIVGLKKNTNPKKVTNEIERTLKGLGLDYHMLGAVTANVEIERIVKDNLLRLIPVVILLVMMVLFFSYRTLTGVFLPILAVSLADVWTVGIMRLLNVSFNTTTSAVPIAIVGIGTAYSIHIISRYYEELHKNIDPQTAVQQSVKHVGMAVLLSALTTIAGFLSLLTADLTPVWQLGIFTSVGIGVTLLMASVMVPAMLILIKPKARKVLSDDGESLFLKKFTTRILDHKVLTISIILLVLIFTAIFIPMIRSDMQIENFLNPNTNMVQSSVYLRNNFGGNDFLFVDFTAKNKNNFKDFYFNRSIRNLSYYAKSFSVVSQTTNIGDVVANLTKAFTKVAYIPGSQDAMSQNYMFINGSKGIDKILSSKDNETISQIMVNTKSMNKVKKVQNALNDFIKKYIFSSYSVRDFDPSNSKLVKAYSDEIKQFVVSRGGNYSDKIVNDLVKVKKMKIGSIIKSLPKDEVFKMFNAYLQENYEDPVKLSEFEKCLNGTEKDSDLNDNYDYFKEDYDQNIRAAYAFELLSKLNTNLDQKYVKELSWYVNDSQVAVPGGDRGLQVKITGVPVLTNKVNDMVFTSQRESMILAYVLVFILFAIQMHSLTMGLLAMIPISLTILMNFGIMGITKISLNAATVTIASITIGTGIDYTIHYLTRFKKEYRSNFDKTKSAIRTSSTSGRAIIINSLAVILGFATFIFSDIGMLRQFGILTTAAMIIAPFLTLTVFPILLSILPEKLLKKFTAVKKHS